MRHARHGGHHRPHKNHARHSIHHKHAHHHAKHAHHHAIHHRHATHKHHVTHHRKHVARHKGTHRAKHVKRTVKRVVKHGAARTHARRATTTRKAKPALHRKGAIKPKTVMPKAFKSAAKVHHMQKTHTFHVHTKASTIKRVKIK